MGMKRRRSYANSYTSNRRRVRRRVGGFVSTAVGVASAAYKSYTKYRRKRNTDRHVAHSGPACTSRVSYVKKTHAAP